MHVIHLNSAKRCVFLWEKNLLNLTRPCKYDEQVHGFIKNNRRHSLNNALAYPVTRIGLSPEPSKITTDQAPIYYERKNSPSIESMVHTEDDSSHIEEQTEDADVYPMEDSFLLNIMSKVKH